MAGGGDGLVADACSRGEAIHAEVLGKSVPSEDRAPIPKGHRQPSRVRVHDGDGKRQPRYRTLLPIEDPHADGKPFALHLAEVDGDGVAPGLHWLRTQRAATANAVAARLGINEVFADLLPDDELTAIRGLQADGRKAAMVGDGINDAPALARRMSESPWAPVVLGCH